MLIKDMFLKPINRDIKGVVKVGQNDIPVIKQELEEYVVTNELQKHFRDFFANYKKGIHGNTDKMGVWISGFFGSGKSHFLKILSYLLENLDVEGKKAIDYFLEDNKIKDPMVVADMKLASSVPTDVILFNIDSKSETSGKKDKDTILNVFLKVFNEKLGYSTNPHVADLERQLDEEGLYETFKEKYKEITGDTWVASRHKFNFFKDRVINTLVEIQFMSLETARDWAKTTTKPYEISISGFAQMVNEYLESKGENHHIVFLVDEVGQYIGDDTNLMLNLQTITEDLGRICQGKAWVIVTSQQDIDSITEVKGRDFSKIQGRFDTRLSLTSANVDEVIKLRILEKTQTANETLSILYENKETIIRNLIIFNDSSEKKLYEDKKDFCKVYPFIPYQFNLLASVLTSIRQHGASGKHLSEGERSMLALFKESAERLMNQGDGTIVPFNIFYDALNKFLDHSHSVVISKALENNCINPNREEDNFNVNVLKTLFMIKYVKEIESNLDNITTLMVSNIDEDRRLLKEKVEEALDILVNQTLVQKNGDIYIFLTDEEQEINRAIENQDVETTDVIKKVSEIIFADIYFEEKVKVQDFKNRYSFGFNREVDDIPFKSNQLFDFGVKVITPNSELNGQDNNLRMLSDRGKDVYVDLPNDAGFLNELRLSMKIEKFLSSSSANNIPKFEEIRAVKRVEMKEHQDRAKLFLQESLRSSKFYVNGDLLELGFKDFKYNLTESLERLVATVYHKLNYITHPMDEVDIYNLFKQNSGSQITLDDGTIPNENAIREVLDYIRIRTRNHTKISLKEIKNRFTKAPYGFLDVDIQWIIAKCFKDGLIGFTLNGNTVSLLNETSEKIVDYITKRAYTDKLLIEEKEIIPENMKRILKNISKEVFKTPITTEDTDTMVMDFNKAANYMINELNSLIRDYGNHNYPGKNTINEGIKLIQMTTSMDKAIDVFKYVKTHEEDYLDFAEDYPPIKAFFEGEQRGIWNKTQDYIDIFEESRSYVVNEKLESVIERMETILKMSCPYNNIKELPELNDEFLNIYGEILDKELEPVKIEINEAENRVMEVLEQSGLQEVFSIKFKQAFMNLMKKAESCNNVAKVNGFRIEADKLKIRFLDEITKEQEQRAKEEESKKKIDTEQTKKVVKPIKKQRNISIKDINPSTSWQIETKEDIEKYLKNLKMKLEKEIEENTILNIEF
ncbi:BREX system P-loop protein BrxC [Clostridium cochlearium]|uniref:BREX system P-loop protein BrxC n=1 Tax=Clostridium cochlearium TaxID=1494 RepID=UPI000BBC9B00|nr:BREX system P-loop protein BrxC [Clostridium cochlearium]MBE6064446.1 BREX system P-loop protein BrxC [Clostridium cochlearium]NME96560.1 BREX system P-loop protein BrxC [Clostridium cochlearium]